MAADLSNICCTECILKPTDINQADIRPLLLEITNHLNLMIWRTTNTTTHVVEFTLIKSEE